MSYIGTVDPISGVDLPGELAEAERWEDEDLTRCERCGDWTGWPEMVGGWPHCPPCVRYAQQSARDAASSLATAAA